MRVVDKVLHQLKNCLEGSMHKAVETDKIEIKDLSSNGDWKELYKTVCAFLNTQGGIIIIGVRESADKANYRFTGFNPNNEDKLKGLPHQFTDDEKTVLDLTQYVRPDLFELIDFLEGQVCAVFVEKLPEDKKYVMYNGHAYERKLTGDHKLGEQSIRRQKELRRELEIARELKPVDQATSDDLDIDKLNDYIQRLNQGMKVETLKADIPSALSFLERKKFLVKNKPTLLGMLVCGNNLFDFIGSRCQVDGYVESQVQIASNKKIFKDNIITLLESSIGFVYTNISTGISAEKGGSTTFEYPERLIRETINNALAHRDYSINKFVNVTIRPGVQIEIKNPGRFREKQILRLDTDIPIRRIIPIPKPHNPGLTDVLKSFDRWEGKGWGMSSLTNMALDNQVDLPYYMLYSDEEIGLTIPRGRVLDDEAISWLKSFSGYIFRKTNGRDLSEEEKTVLAYFYKSERLNKNEKYTIALTPDNNHFQVITELKDLGLITKLSNSPELYPTFVVDRVIVKTDFISELREIFGGSLDSLGSHYRDTLNSIYHLNKFSKDVRDINAAQVGDFLYFKEHRKITDVESYNGYKRKIRNVINRLTANEFLLKEEGGRPNYKINENYNRTPSLFDE